MQIVKLTKEEVEILTDSISYRCYKNYEFEFLNGEEIRLFRFKEIPAIVDESFFEILPRLAEVEDEIYIEETQMEEICGLIEKKLESEYEVFSREDLDEALDEWRYNNDPYNWY